MPSIVPRSAILTSRWLFRGLSLCSNTRPLLPLSLLSLSVLFPSPPIRQSASMAWSAAQHNPARSHQQHRSGASSLTLAIYVAAVVIAVALALWKQIPAARSFLSVQHAPSLTATSSSSAAVSSLVACRECSSDSNAGLIDNMLRRGVIRSPVVAAAMKRVDRGHYITPAASDARRLHPSSAYVDSPQYIGFGATISAPHMHAMCAELMLDAIGGGKGDGEGVSVLDVGSGSGYLAAVLSRLIGPKGRVYGIDHIQELVDTSASNLRSDDPALLNTVQIARGDGRLGLPSAAPFNAIHVGAAAAEVPAALIEQLKVGGLLVIPVGEENDDQFLKVIEKGQDGELKQRTVCGVRYVPLTSEDSQRMQR